MTHKYLILSLKSLNLAAEMLYDASSRMSLGNGDLSLMMYTIYVIWLENCLLVQIKSEMDGAC